MVFFLTHHCHPTVKSLNALQNTFETECIPITQMINTNCYMGQIKFY